MIQNYDDTIKNIPEQTKHILWILQRTQDEQDPESEHLNGVEATYNPETNETTYYNTYMFLNPDKEIIKYQIRSMFTIAGRYPDVLFAQYMHNISDTTPDIYMYKEIQDFAHTQKTIISMDIEEIFVN